MFKWIPYDRLKDVKQIGKGGFGTMHYAKWIDGPIDEWILKINNRKEIKEIVKIQKQKSRNTLICDGAADGNLREYLKTNFNNINWSQKFKNLCYLSEGLTKIHELDIVHQDFHPGNILSSDFKNLYGFQILD
ncbi:hypothetical protein Glove_130g9 [Diversispora epigaea]|uniref:Protein kinase domain-containing protein n=1 Tax=Diversispora epigaea TaxID=1348612 RepID=A0A397J4K5_9GLOM|nr:hypothetical protein Glove_130g9 [Diversispora epigaea]